MRMRKKPNLGNRMERCAALIETLESQVQTCLLAASFGDAQPVPADMNTCRW